MTVVSHVEVAGGVEVLKRVGTEGNGESMLFRWEKDRVLLLETSTVSNGKTEMRCSFKQKDGTPGLVMAKLPIQAEDYGKQVWNDRQCSGALELRFEEIERVTAAGESWDAWRVRFRLEYRFASAGMQAELNGDGLRWLAPELGMVGAIDASGVRADERWRFQFGLYTEEVRRGQLLAERILGEAQR